MPAETAAAQRRCVALVTQGCKVNQYETQVLREGFLARGWTEVPFGREADLTVINSCTVTAGSDRDLRKLVGRARRASPAGRVIVAGCRPEVDPAGCAGLAGVDRIVGNARKLDLPAAATDGGWERLAGGGARPAMAPVTGLAGRSRPILKVQDGCDLRCSYCIVPLARGPARSRPAADVLAVARRLESGGYREVVLSGIQLGLYRDPAPPGRGLADLLAYLLAGTRRLRLRLGSLLPRHVTPDLIALFRDEPARLCPHFHVSLQSGDDGVLAAMRRPYRREEYRDLLARLVAELDDPCLGTDVIVGFPGEDAAAFARTRDFLASLPLAYGHVFPFSPRPGTEAARLLDDVPHADKARRGHVLRDLLAAGGRAYRARQAGRTLRVVIERRLADGRWLGTSGNYQRVVLAAPALRGGGRDASPLGAGDLVAASVTGVEGSRLTARADAGREAAGGAP
ncbi:MAG: MiaB/RimO family radical SAM methylthiotransferase [Candidatus Krumholzibacteriota bacterium]|nr:MiaB/RimO family radical SAM methylthiotransferase [Candidatus Krumholzibacteriota bacterium]